MEQVQDEPDDDYEKFNAEEEKQEEEIIDHFKSSFKELLDEIKSKVKKNEFEHQKPQNQNDGFFIQKKEEKNPVSESQEKIGKVCREPRIYARS